MKILALLLLPFLFGKSCQGNNDLNTATIEYSAKTRGFYEKYVISNHSLNFYKDRVETETFKTIPITDEQWNGIIAVAQKLELGQLPKLKAPSEKRFYDGAAIANLKITYKDSVYQTENFDHGNPPAEIVNMVNTILSLTKEKNEN